MKHIAASISTTFIYSSAVLLTVCPMIAFLESPLKYSWPHFLYQHQWGRALKSRKDSNKTFMPSKLIDATKRKTSVPFSTSAQTVSSVGIFLHCINCCWPRLLYAQKKVQASVLNTLKCALNGFQFICGTSLQEIILDDNTPEQKIVSKVFARENISCMSNIETPYFSSGRFTKICIICGKSTNLHPDDKINFPKCHRCNNARIKITRRRKILVEDLGRKKKEVMYFICYRRKKCVYSIALNIVSLLTKNFYTSGWS